MRPASSNRRDRNSASASARPGERAAALFGSVLLGAGSLAAPGLIDTSGPPDSAGPEAAGPGIGEVFGISRVPSSRAASIGEPDAGTRVNPGPLAPGATGLTGPGFGSFAGSGKATGSARLGSGIGARRSGGPESADGGTADGGGRGMVCEAGGAGVPGAFIARGRAGAGAGSTRGRGCWAGGPGGSIRGGEAGADRSAWRDLSRIERLSR